MVWRAMALSLVTLLCVVLLPFGEATLLAAGNLEEDLNHIANTGLGVSGMQSFIDKEVTFTGVDVDGSTILTQLSADLSTKFGSRFKAVRDLRDVLEAEYTSFSTWTNAMQCCQIGIMYKAVADKDNFCVQMSSMVADTVHYINKHISQKMKSNLVEAPAIQWQYFGTESGVFFQYPSARSADCGGYDPRFRPWYVETANPEPKDVVIVLDKSYSMVLQQHLSKTLLSIAKEAAKTVIDTLNPRDRVGLVTFSTWASTPESSAGSSSCYTSSMAFATPHNKAFLRKYIDSITAQGSTYYSRAIARAFTLIGNTTADPEHPNRRQVILFMTDGDPNSSDVPVINSTIATENAKMSNKVSILTFAIGIAISDYGIDILRGMTTASQEKPGQFLRVTNADKLRLQLASYYNYFGKKPREQPIVSAPYFDANGLGLVTTVSLPVYYGANFAGVVGIDITLEDLLSDVTGVQHGLQSYAFVMDGEGKALYHPLLPQPFSVTDDPVYVRMKALENSAGAQSVISSMKQGNSGQMALTSARVQTLGDTYRDGIVTTQVPSTYYWQKVAGTDFSVGFVVASGDKSWTYTLKNPPSEIDFLYHRIDLSQPTDASLCKHFSRLAVMSDSTVKFGSQMFVHPFDYLDAEETAASVNIYSNAFQNGNTADPPNLKTGARAAISLTARVHDSWFRPDWAASDAVQFAVWRYIATSNGVIRMLPGTSLHKNYDPVKRAWYQRAVAHKGSKVMSPPYLDAFGAGYVVTLSHTLVQSSQTVDSSLVGVLGIDFTVNYFYHLLSERFPKCQGQQYSCFIVDSSGYLIVHQDFITVSGAESPVVENVHMTIKEKAIAEHLVKNNHMVRKQCTNIYNIRKQYFYQISLDNVIQNMDGTPAYELQQVPGTNMFVGIKKQEGTGGTCHCIDEKTNVPPRCSSSSSGTVCECPCYQTADYDFCTNSFSTSSEGVACPPDTMALNMTANVKAEEFLLRNKPQCIDPMCDTRSTQSECSIVAACSWCERGKDGNMLSTSYCGVQNECFFGQVGYPSPYNLMFEDILEDIEAILGGTGANVQMVSSAIFGTGGLLLLCVSLFWLKKKWCGKRSSATSVPPMQAGWQQEPDAIPGYQMQAPPPSPGVDPQYSYPPSVPGEQYPPPGSPGVQYPPPPPPPSSPGSPAVQYQSPPTSFPSPYPVQPVSYVQAPADQPAAAAPLYPVQQTVSPGFPQQHRASVNYQSQFTTAYPQKQKK